MEYRANKKAGGRIRVIGLGGPAIFQKYRKRRLRGRCGLSMKTGSIMRAWCWIRGLLDQSGRMKRIAGYFGK